jgi:hypothetical protein
MTGGARSELAVTKTTELKFAPGTRQIEPLVNFWTAAVGQAVLADVTPSKSLSN